MSLKSLIQLIILIIIFVIIGGVYFKYFAKEKILVTQTSQLTTTEKTQNLKQENKNNDTSEIIELSDKEKSNQNKNNNLNRDNLTNSEKDKSEVEVINKDADISNIVKDVEYLTTDKNGNKYRILARSGRTNKSNRDILDLNTVRGEISSKQRSTIFILINSRLKVLPKCSYKL